MTPFTIFAKDSGEILRQIQSPDLATVALNIDPDEAIIPGDFAAATHRIVMIEGPDGEPVPQAEMLPPRPDGVAIFDYDQGAWRARSDAEKAADLSARRIRANLSRQDFCLALKRAGILPPAEAIAAAKGDWPATFNAALPGLALRDVDADEAQIIWASATRIMRNHPLIGALSAAAGLTDIQVDALFGISAEDAP